jgi:hypothetical protein
MHRALQAKLGRANAEFRMQERPRIARMPQIKSECGMRSAEFGMGNGEERQETLNDER